MNSPKSLDGIDRISLAYWFPILQETGVLVPKTQYWETDADFWPLFDGEASQSANVFLNDMKQRCNEWGYPLFLRTGHTSAKHSWKDSCYVAKEDGVGRSVFSLLEYSAMAIPRSWPWNIWAIREFLDLDTRFTAFWGDMPINNERRYFIEDGEIICRHPYWPPLAFDGVKTSTEGWRQILDKMNSEEASGLDELTLSVASVFDGTWSLDWAKAKNGDWYAIDMAPAEVSYHWPGCERMMRIDRTPNP